MQINITYGITVCDESEELNNLLTHLIPLIDNEDEIIVLRDISNTNNLVTKVIEAHTERFPNRIRTIERLLNKDFAAFKNNLIEHANGNYLFQIDADEIPNEFLIENIKAIININKEVDCFYVPRVNKVLGITEEHITKWRWSIDNYNRINYPDLQMRLFKLDKEIKWKNKVHEVLDNYKITTILPYEEDEDFCLYHIKTISKQEAQNKLYDSL
jgi:glycosyltransferase involved in cell wall biosynthesis